MTLAQKQASASVKQRLAVCDVAEDKHDRDKQSRLGLLQHS